MMKGVLVATCLLLAHAHRRLATEELLLASSDDIANYRIQDNVPVRGVAEEVVPDYGQDDDSEEAPVVTKKVAKKKFYDPEILLLDPKPRTFSNVSLVNAQPCGGAEKSLVHYVTTSGSRNFV